MRIKVLHSEHPDVATSYNNVGGAYFYLGDYVNALKYWKRALEISESVLGNDHPDTILLKEAVDNLKILLLMK